MTRAGERAPIPVAAAVIERGDGHVLLAERPAGKPWAGYWEFPGGKFEPGEGPAQALVRELNEELGIEVDAITPWIARDYAYPEKTVRLHFFRVPAWHGEPHGREGQRVSWESPAAPRVAPLLPANGPILAALALPPLYAISNAAQLGVPEFLARLKAALARGVRLIQLRERGLAARDLAALAVEVVAAAHAHGARVLVNGDVTLAREAGADGVHLTAGQLRALSTRPPLALCAASCHDADELARAAALGLDFVVLSPVLPTASHPGEPGIGWQRFAERVRDYPLPVYALGGMRPELLTTARTHGAHGVALLGGIWTPAHD
jgi:8-oxo-dGTP diphosphatase